MATVTDICNAAISHCGTRSKVSAIDEGSAEANACLTHFALARDATLRAFDWNFARMTRVLAALADPPARWSRKYALPGDCLRLLRLHDGRQRFELAADRDTTGAFVNVVLCDVSPATAVYTARVEDPLRWDAGFVDAMAYGLAARICFELTGKEDRMRTLAQLWQAALRQAAADAANERAPSRTLLPSHASSPPFSSSPPPDG